MPLDFRQGDHICVLYDSEHEQRDTAARYLAHGLRKGEQVLYAAGSAQALHEFRIALGNRGINVDAALERGALLERTHAEAHLAGGAFDPELMLGMLDRTLEDALNGGFTGLRTCGDMSWLLEHHTDWRLILEYEALLNQFFHDRHGAGMCQYDQRRMPGELLDHALATHTSAVVEDRHTPNPFYKPPVIARARTPQPEDVPWKIAELRRRA